MPILFGFAAVIAIIATVLAITRLNAVHALLYLATSLLAVAVAIYALGAPYIAALEVIIYAGAIVVLIVFVTMMLNLGEASTALEKQWQPGRGWIGPAILAILLLGEFLWSMAKSRPPAGVHVIGPKAVSLSLLGPYVVGVELASMLLTAAVVGAYHLGFGLQRQQDQQVEAGQEGGRRGTALTGAGPRSATPSDPLTLNRPGTPESPSQLGSRLFAFRGRATIRNFAAFSHRLCPQCKRRDPRVSEPAEAPR